MITDQKAPKIVVHKRSLPQTYLGLTLLVLVLVTIYGFVKIDTQDVPMGEATIKTIQYFWTMFTSPRGVASHFGVKESSTVLILLAGLKQVGITLALAFLTTLIGGVVSLFLGLLAAQNLSTPFISNVVKTIVALMRSVPTVLWVLIFAIGAGLGSVAAVIGMSFHTVGYLLKAYSESFEELDEGVIEALKASGATWFQIVFQAVFPTAISYILSWTFIRFEINFAVAVAMGAAAGAGGIGYNLFMSSGYFYDIREIGFITYLILVVAFIMEYFATGLKERYHLQN
ncbi:PhnE/PtxC family ABC transporter permease [Spirochaeta cellobiosiphila]|uniref:PhnE/PtxC family ABC transporter permease n=1 Tax=Spirochaeta cellobiosiphila TaxID=504483 RepID=UPI000427B161|nr:ABC transporter permease subunit [Spirochaeta cellobiosiphila]